MLWALMIIASTFFSAGQDVPQPGVPLSLAEARARRVSDVRYDLHFAIPASVSEPVRGRVTLRFSLSDASAPLALDFSASAAHLRSVSSRGARVEAAVANEHILLPSSALRAGGNEITIDFVADDGPLNRNPEFLYTLFVPARARFAFPCFDQPDLKGRFTLSLAVPRAWEALANGKELERNDDGAVLRVRYAETKPLPTYLFAFAAGKFKVEVGERGGRRFRMFHRETDAQKVARNREAIFDLHAGALKWLEEYSAIPYAFGKFDFLLVPAFQFGGMEHAGAIFYNAPALLLDPSATQNQKLGRASLIAHETAHMWFGDLVTMRWFDDVWMKEVFANFMAAKIVNPAFPEINHELRFLLAHYPAAYDVDRTPGTNAIRQRLDNLNEAGSLYGAIIYQKAPIVMRQLEMIVGVEALRDGLREYLRTHSYANATWPDLIALLDRRAPQDLAAWSRAWVEEAGRPIIRVTVDGEGDAVPVVLTQEDPIPARGLTWTQHIDVVAGSQRDIVGGPGLMTGPRWTRTFGVRPLFVLPNANGIGYGNFVLDPASRAYLLERLPGPALMRGAALVTLWEEMLDGRVTAAEIMSLLLSHLPRESDELNIQRMLSYAEQAYWRFLPEPSRTAVLARLESVLRAGLDAAKTPSLKSAWFSALRDIARTPDTLAWLERVWRKTETVPGLDLAEPDDIALSLELAVRGGPAWKEILDTQYERIENPDRKSRFAFVRPALSPDQGTRDTFFVSLADLKNRRREPWVLEGLAYLHHPLRAAASEKYIPESLAMLREIQRTGDIFFPKRWMDATLSGHSSTAAAETVSSFLARLPPGYPDRLRRVILSSADDLFRVTRVR